jgi:rare lipoprotein A
MKTVPLGTTVVVMSLADPTKSIEVTVTDRGPYAPGRVIDLTKTAFEKLFGNIRVGLGDVVVKIPGGPP